MEYTELGVRILKELLAKEKPRRGCELGKRARPLPWGAARTQGPLPLPAETPFPERVRVGLVPQ